MFTKPILLSILLFILWVAGFHWPKGYPYCGQFYTMYEFRKMRLYAWGLVVVIFITFT